VRINFWFGGTTLILLVALAHGQTFDVHNGNSSAAGAKKPASTHDAKPANSGTQGLGWGSNIEVVREARAVEDNLKRNDYTAAVTHAQQAVKLAPQDSDLWFLLGYAARLAGQHSVSVDAFKRGLQMKPNSPRGLSGLAQTYAKMGRVDEARQLLSRVIESSPKDVSTLNLAGELMLNSDPGRAAEVLRRADDLQPSARTELLLARSYQRLNQPEQSRQYLTHARNRAPRDPEILRAIAGQYRDGHQFDLAISTLQALPSKPPDVLAELAYTYELSGNKQKAVEFYLQAAKAAKGNIELQLSAAQALVGVEQIDTARGFLEKIQERSPNHYRLHAILGQIERLTDNTPKAIREYQLALRNLPRGNPEGTLYPIQLRLELHDLYDRSGDKPRAKEQLDLAASEIQAPQATEAPRTEFLRLRGAIETASGDLTAADRDLKEALSLAPSSVTVMLNYAVVLWKLGRQDAARQMYEQALNADRDNPLALESLGYLAREMGNNDDAEKYFIRAVHKHPRDYAPYLALGDLYASQRKFPAAQENYEAANERMTNNPLVMAGGANAALEAHKLDLAQHWLDRAKGAANDNPHLMRERERYLTLRGSYLESSKLGFKVLEQLPHDAEAPIYLAYDLYYLGRYKEAFDLSVKYEPLLANNKDFALIEGYVHARSGELQEALSDFSRALERDPKMATGYVNRGYVFNDLRNPQKAVPDFQAAIQLQPEYGEAHLGLAYSYLQQHHPQMAMGQLDISEKLLGKSHTSHLGRAEGFRQEQQFAKAELEYRVALKEEPKDLPTQLALADTLYRLHSYNEAIDTFNVAVNLSPDNPFIYSQMAQAYAKLRRREDTFRYIQAAEQSGREEADVLMATGNALLILGEENSAMQRFSSALDAPDGNRVSTRLAIAEIFVRKGHWDDARRQIGLAFAEARVGDAQPATTSDLVQAGNILLAMHDFDLAKTYFEKAGLAGASQRDVVLGLVNTYLALGDTVKAQDELASLSDPGNYKDDYEYMIAEANVYRERHDTAHALSGFARASRLGGEDDEQALQRTEYELAGEEGRQINPELSLLSTGSFAPVLEDINIYTLDARLLGSTNSAALPPPRHSFQSLGEAHYRVHLHGFPIIEGFVGESMTNGRVSLPSISVIQDRNTYDTMFSGGVSPVVHMGSNTLAFNTGLQFTLRRDSISPVALNQNLFRQFLYMSSSSFFNWISVRGHAIHESGPFGEQDLHSRDASANLEFTVGRPWGNTALLTGYSVRDLLFRPAIREYFSTSTYVGMQHKFGKRLTATLLGEYLRSWRVEGTQFAIAQAMLPGARFEYRRGVHWTIEGEFTLSRGQGFHIYDNANSQVLISYIRPVNRRFDDGDGDISVSYPSRFSFGLQQQTFYNFTGQGKTVVLPVVRLTLF